MKELKKHTILGLEIKSDLKTRFVWGMPLLFDVWNTCQPGEISQLWQWLFTRCRNVRVGIRVIRGQYTAPKLHTHLHSLRIYGLVPGWYEDSAPPRSYYTRYIHIYTQQYMRTYGLVPGWYEDSAPPWSYYNRYIHIYTQQYMRTYGLVLGWYGDSAPP